MKRFIFFLIIILFFSGGVTHAGIIAFRTSPDNTRAVFNSLSAKKVFTLLIYAESRKDASFEGTLAVASVVLERNDKYRYGIKKICLYPKWFSCFNPTDKGFPQLKKIALNYDYFLRKDARLRECQQLAERLMNGSQTRHETIEKYNCQHYVAVGIENSWTRKMVIVAVIDGHKFLV